MLRLFYVIKPLLPRKLQISLRKFRARRIFAALEPPFLTPTDRIRVSESALQKPTMVLLTHDVETGKGVDAIDEIRLIEEARGFRSTWNFVLDKYGDVGPMVSELAAAGHECGAHGLYHDGKLFNTERTFRTRMVRIKKLSDELGLAGFRSPSLLRKENLLADMDFLWDSSIPAWDPFQPQPGGCLRYSPFLLGEKLVEFPVTLWQDFTIFRELEQMDAAIWIAQAEAIRELGGLINIIVHPDYFDDVVKNAYIQFLNHLSSRDEFNVTLPSTLASEVLREGTL